MSVQSLCFSLLFLYPISLSCFLFNDTATTQKPLISSSSGPWTQFTRTFTDLQPYSYLLLLPLLLTPIIETLKLLGRHRKRKPEPWVSAPMRPQNTPPPPPAQAGPDKPADMPSSKNP